MLLTHVASTKLCLTWPLATPGSMTIAVHVCTVLPSLAEFKGTSLDVSLANSARHSDRQPSGRTGNHPVPLRAARCRTGLVVLTSTVRVHSVYSTEQQKQADRPCIQQQCLCNRTSSLIFLLTTSTNRSPALRLNLQVFASITYVDCFLSARAE